MSQSGQVPGIGASHSGASHSGAGTTMHDGDTQRGQQTDHLNSVRVAPSPVVLVVRAHAGNATHGDEAVQALREVGVEVGEVLQVSALDRTPSLGREWLARGFRAAVACGGDGTIGAVASHVAGSGLPLGILPMGTSNDTARSLGIPMQVDEAAGVIAAGHTGLFDAGQALPAQTAPLPATGKHVAARQTGAAGAYFLHALTLGFNAQFARLATDVAHRSRLGGLNYAVSLMQALATYRPVALTLRFEGLVALPNQQDTRHRARGQSGQRAKMDEVVIAHNALELAVVNAPVFGGALNLRVPQINMHDRLLDFVLFESLKLERLRETVESALAALARLPERVRHRGSGATGTAAPLAQPRQTDADLGLALPGVHRYRARAAVIESAQPLNVTLDGEVRAQTPILVRVAPHPLMIFLPGQPEAVTQQGQAV